MYVHKHQKNEFMLTFDEYRYPYHSYLSELVENLTLKYIHQVIRKNEKNKLRLSGGKKKLKRCEMGEKTVMYANKKKISHKNCIVFFYLFTFVWLLHLNCIFSMCIFPTFFKIFFPPESLDSGF